MDMNEIVKADDSRSETLEAEIFNLTNRLAAIAREEADYITHAAAIEMTRCASEMLNAAAHIDTPSEFFGELALGAEPMGQVLMQFTCPEMDIAHKAYLLSVASHMGPDWLEWLRRDVAFMVKVESF